MPRTIDLVITPALIDEAHRSGFPRIKNSDYEVAVIAAVQALKDGGSPAAQLRKACYKATPKGGTNPLRLLVLMAADMGLVEIKTGTRDVGPGTIPDYIIL